MNRKLFKSKFLFACVSALCIFSQGECYGETKVYKVDFGYENNTISDAESDYSNSSKNKFSKSITLKNYKWTLVINGDFSITNQDYFVQFGAASNKNGVKSVTFKTSDIPGRIKSVSVVTSTAKTTEIDAYLNISINGNEIVSKQKVIRDTKATEIYKTFKISNTCFDKGEIEINIFKEKAEAKAIRVYRIEIEYNDATEYTLDEASSSNTIEANSDAIVGLTRTFSSGYWNTVCLPFSLSADSIKSIFGEGTLVKEFTSATETTMNFTDSETIEAGTPYLMKPAKNVSNYYFENVATVADKPKTITHGGYSFVGIYNATSLNSKDVFLGTDGKLYNPSTNSSPLKGTRAYIQLPEGVNTNGAKLNIDGFEDATGISSITNVKNIENDVFYNINGQIVGNDIDKLGKGLYIRNGKKVIVK